MNPGKILWLALAAGLAFTAIAAAQTPAIPAAPAGVAAPTPAPANLWRFLVPRADAGCKNGVCNLPREKPAAGPFAAPGPLLLNRWAQYSLVNDLKKPPESPEGMSARIKADEEEAGARRAAVRFLAGVDCNYWPEAVETLKLALRKDRNEAVRFEAALALRNGCCNNEIMKALEVSAAGSGADGFPAEHSARVRWAAAAALAHCPILQRDPEVLKAEERRGQNAHPNVDPDEYYRKVAKMSQADLVASARAVLVSLKESTKAQPASIDPAPVVETGAPARQPFFASLTKALTGKQDFIPGRPDFVPAFKIPASWTADAKYVVPSTNPLTPARDSSAPRPREFQAAGPIEIAQPAAAPASLGSPLPDEPATPSPRR